MTSKRRVTYMADWSSGNRFFFCARATAIFTLQIQSSRFRMPGSVTFLRSASLMRSVPYQGRAVAALGLTLDAESKAGGEVREVVGALVGGRKAVGPDMSKRQKASRYRSDKAGRYICLADKLANPNYVYPKSTTKNAPPRTVANVPPCLRSKQPGLGVEHKQRPSTQSEKLGHS